MTSEPQNSVVPPQYNENHWRRGRMILFRFFFLFLGLISLVCWALNIFFTSGVFLKNGFNPDKMFAFLAGPLHWMDKRLFHLGYDPKIHESFPQDNHFGAVFYLSVLFMSIITTIVWSSIDIKKLNYEKLFFWFSLYLRYTLAVTIIGYGIDKLIPVQMQWPGAAGMLTPFGEMSRFRVLWNFMGVSPGYMVLTGGCEIIAGLLLLSRRTMMFGYLFLLTILVNVVALNWFYNVPVKMFSAQLMLFNLWLLLPYLKELFQFFFFGSVSKVTIKHFTFKTGWKKQTVTGALVIIPLVISSLIALGSFRRYRQQQVDAKKEKIFTVTDFVVKDAVQAPAKDLLRWRNLLFTKNFAVIIDMKDNQDWYQCDIDSTKKTLSLHDDPASATPKIFHYTYPAKDQFQLTGIWKGEEIKVSMKASPVDSIPLNKEKIKLIRD